MIFIAATWLPLSWVEETPLCLFHYLSGWDCPGCGLTRAFVVLFKGNLRQALMFNALAPVIAVYLGIYALDNGWSLWKGKRPNWSSPEGQKVITVLFGVLAFGQWAYKSGLHLMTFIQKL